MSGRQVAALLCAVAALFLAGCSTPQPQGPTVPTQPNWRGAPPGVTTTGPSSAPSTTTRVREGNTTAEYVERFATAFFAFDIPTNSGGNRRWSTQMQAWMDPRSAWMVQGDHMVGWWAAALTAGASARDVEVTGVRELWTRDDGTSMWRVRGTHTLYAVPRNTRDEDQNIGTYPFEADVAVGPAGRVIYVSRVSSAAMDKARWEVPEAPDVPTRTSTPTPASSPPTTPSVGPTPTG